MTEERSKLEQFKELVELEPDDPLVQYGLGMEHLKLGEFAEAVRAFRRTLELKPDYSAAHRELGKALDKLGERQAAREAYERGKQVAQEKGDLQTVREIELFLKRLGPS